jgi:lipopolysaccharide/colanic/teichoic acid biosynthesis glycosyltransferase
MHVRLDSLVSGQAFLPPLTRKQFDFAPWTALPSPPTVRARDEMDCAGTVSFVERAAALAILVLISPLMLLVALAIKLESPGGPVLFRQERVGLDRRRRRTSESGSAQAWDRRATRGAGQVFMIYKFRTMIPDAERTTGPVWATEGDSRITRAGAILRQLRLDEFPQLLNIVRGQMRLIGPRPERPHFVSQLVQEIPDYAQRHRVHPGITGLAQVERDYDSCVKDVRTKLKYDLFYVNNRCGLMDAKILVKTVGVMVRGKGAR